MSIEVQADMAGVVVKVLIAPGAEVQDGACIIILESMKMEIPILVEDGGTVQTVLVEEGSSVQQGQVLAELLP